jgi:hypothetical protein
MKVEKSNNLQPSQEYTLGRFRDYWRSLIFLITRLAPDIQYIKYMTKNYKQKLKNYRAKYVNSSLNGYKILRIIASKGQGTLCKCKCLTCNTIHIRRLITVEQGITRGCFNCYGNFISNSQKLSNLGGPKNKVVNWYKANAKVRKIVFAISTKEAIDIMEKPCYFCGEVGSMKTFRRVHGKQRRNKDECWRHNGIDRKDNSLPYTSRNCIPCCKYCNRLKWNLSEKEFYLRIRKILKYKRIMK